MGDDISLITGVYRCSQPACQPSLKYKLRVNLDSVISGWSFELLPGLFELFLCADGRCIFIADYSVEMTGWEAEGADSGVGVEHYNERIEGWWSFAWFGFIRGKVSFSWSGASWLGECFEGLIQPPSGATLEVTHEEPLTCAFLLANGDRYHWHRGADPSCTDPACGVECWPSQPNVMDDIDVNCVDVVGQTIKTLNMKSGSNVGVLRQTLAERAGYHPQVLKLWSLDGVALEDDVEVASLPSTISRSEPLQVVTCSRTQQQVDGLLDVSCINLGGEPLATLKLQQGQDKGQDLRGSLAKSLAVPERWLQLVDVSGNIIAADELVTLQ